ncbi:MAG: hypothetical protein ACREGA_02985 [Candidatus Saccharimonadales bacterium]
MAVYDDQDQRQEGHHNPLTPEDDELRRLTGINPDEEGAMDREAHNGAAEDLARQQGLSQPLTDEKEDAPKPKSLTPGQLAGAETAAGGSASDGSSANNFGYRQEPQSKLAKARSKIKIKGKGKKGKFLLLGGGLGGVVIILVLILLLGSLLIPNFIQNVTEYEFARVARNMTRNEIQTGAEKYAIDASSASAKAQIQKQFSDDADNTLARLNNLRPSKIVNKLATTGQVQYEHTGGVLTKVTVNGIDYKLRPNSFFDGDKLHPIQLFKNRANAYKHIESLTLKSTRDLPGVTGTLIRGGVSRTIRDKLDIGLVGWLYKLYQGKSPTEARALEEKAAYNRTKDLSAASTADEEINKADQKANQQQTTDINNPKTLAKITQNNGENGVSDGAVSAITKALSGNVFKTIASSVSTILTIGLPFCIIYSGSLDKSQPTIDAQSNELQREFYATASQADQQKYGNTNAEAVGATNWKLNGATLNQSNAIKRASGQPVNTSGTESPQASANGQYKDLFSATLGYGAGSKALSGIASFVCPKLTSLPGIAALTVIGAGTSITGIKAAFAGGIKVTVKDAVKKIAAKFATGKAIKTTGKNALKKILGEGTKIAGIAGTTILAKFAVANSSGQAHNGTATGLQYDNEVDMGANLNANETERKEFYSQPLTTTQTNESDKLDRQNLAAQFKQQSAYQRYFALSNSQSLISRLGLNLYDTIYGKPIFSTFSSLTSKLFNPIAMLPHMFGSLNSSVALAASTGGADNSHYGIVQWGWPQTEVNLINNDPSYQPLENAKIFAQETAHYNATHPNCDFVTDIEVGQPHCPSPSGGPKKTCFTDSMGTLLADGAIQRDSNGNVNQDSGACAPHNLDQSQDFQGEKQAVFRYRLLYAYNCTLDNMEEIQAAGSQPVDMVNGTNNCPNNSPSNQSNGSGAATSSGSTTNAGTQQVAQQILTTKNISLTGRDVQQDIQDAANGKKGSAGVMTSSAILKLILTVGQKHKVTLSAIQSGGSGHCNNTAKASCPNDPHYNGDAVDFSQLDGKALTGRDSGSLAILSIAEGVLPSGSAIGQSQCGTTPPLPAGWTTFEDTCNHLHVQVPKGTS